MLEEFWTEKEVEMLSSAKTYDDLKKVAFTIIDRMPLPLGQVCGPLTTGGKGSLEVNMATMATAIDKLKSEGANIFNQLPFEPMMQALRKVIEPGKYSTQLLDDFYLPIFKSGKISTLYFLPNWESSTGTRWEREQAQALGIKIVDLETD